MKNFDFNAIQQPVFPVTLKDDDKTVVHVTYPTVELLDRFMAMVPELQDVAQAKDGHTTRAVFGLVAEILSTNEDGCTFTAEELRDQYHMTLYGVFQFVAAYMAFIKEAQDAKN